MKVILHPNEAIEINTIGKYPQKMALWVDGDGTINHKLKE